MIAMINGEARLIDEDPNEKFKTRGWCIICHTPLERKNTCYCDDCRAIGRANDERILKKLKESDDSKSGMFGLLASEVIHDFMREYKTHMRSLLANPFSESRQQAVKADERYIRGLDFAILTMHAVDPEAVIRFSHDQLLEERRIAQEQRIQAEVEKRLKR